MWQLKNIFSKKSSTPNKIVDFPVINEFNPLKEAQKLSNIVNDGLSNDNFSDINSQLANLAHEKNKKDEYLFASSGLFSTSVALVTSIGTACICIYFILIGTLTSIFSSEYLSIGLFGLSISLIILFINIYLVKKFILAIQFKTRFDVYNEFLGFKNWEFIGDLAKYSNQNENIVINDLQQAIKEKLIPQGHLSRNNLVVMISDKIYDTYMEKPAVYDRYFQTKLEERQRIAARSPQISFIMKQGEEYIKKLNNHSALIKDKTIQKKIDHITNIVSMIFHELDIKPENALSLSPFLNYYLPTMDKLLNAYVSIIEKKVIVQNLANEKKQIEKILNTIIISFESILEKLYEAHEMDIISDISTLEISMRSDGLL